MLIEEKFDHCANGYGVIQHNPVTAKSVKETIP